MLNRHSLFWKLVGVLALFCLLVVSFNVDIERRLNEATSRLPRSVQDVLHGYADEADAILRLQGPDALAQYLRELRSREGVWAAVVDAEQRSLSSEPLTEEEWERLSFVRPLDGLMGRPGSQPTFFVPFDSGKSRLVMELPDRLNPRANLALWKTSLTRVLPTGLAVVLGILLYRLFIAPLVALRRQANALSENDLTARAGARMTRRKDELGELARAFDHMADRLEATVSYQRRLLRDLSHELRTPLSRLRAASERAEDGDALRVRLDREVEIMQRLVENSLELAWMDSERPRLEVEPIRISQLWEMLAEDAAFETGIVRSRLKCEVDDDCIVSANLSSLAQALENLLRNAIRHSPEEGCIALRGVRKAEAWHLMLVDQGPGVDEDRLEFMFEPFARLDSARPGDGGFGLGLSIARRAIELQGGQLWATNREHGGLAMHIQLPVAGR